jgi:hypothetical protein
LYEIFISILLNMSFFKILNSPVRFKLFILFKVPAAFFSGVKLIQANTMNSLVTIKYKWLTQNPFKSIYFASLSMAAEMCSGVLALAFIKDSKQKVSMLVTNMDAEFFKKATGVVSFTCVDGNAVKKAIEQTIENKQPTTVRVLSKGTNNKGEVIANFYFTWSFKLK